jgi:hypothetical protein
LVVDGRIRDSLEPLIDFLLEQGLGSRGFRGCVTVPHGKLSEGGKHRTYRRTVHVWIVEDVGPTNREVRRFLGTRDFVSWLASKPLRGPIGDKVTTASDFQKGLDAISRLSPGSAHTVRSSGTVRPTPVPSTGGPRVAPPPSVANVPVGRPPSYVSEVGDVRSSWAELQRLEAEFKDTPRVQGGVAFDNDEYFRRLDALNAERRRLGLPPVEGVTPSTYAR